MKLTAIPAAVLVLLAANAAMAQDTTVALPDTLVGFVVQIAFLVVSGTIAVFLPVILTRLAAKYGLQIEQERRDALQTTLTNAAGGLLQRLGAEALQLRVDMRNKDVADAVNRALKGAPDAIKWAGLTEEEIARRILEKVALVSASNTAISKGI